MGKTIAKVEIVSARVAHNNMFVEAQVEIKGIKSKRRYMLPEDISSTKIQEHITNKLQEEENENVGKSFKVEI